MDDDDDDYEDSSEPQIIRGVVADSLILAVQDESILMMMTDVEGPALIHYLDPVKARKLAACILNMADDIDVEEVM